MAYKTITRKHGDAPNKVTLFGIGVNGRGRAEAIVWVYVCWWVREKEKPTIRETKRWETQNERRRHRNGESL